MKFFIDTANLDEIKEAQDLGILDGVTTNPSLMAKEGITGKNNVTALDTGCVWGKKLSALRLEDNRIFSCNKIN